MIPTYVNLNNEYGKAKLLASPKDSTILNYHLDALKVAKRLGYLKGELESYERLATVYQFVFSNSNKALDYCHKVIETIGDNEEFKNKAIRMNTNIGAIYSNLREYRKSLNLL